MQGPLERIARQYPEYGYLRTTVKLHQAYGYVVNHKFCNGCTNCGICPSSRVPGSQSPAGSVTEARGEMEQKNGILKRLKSIEGHIRRVHRMVEEDKYCIDILKQTLAVQRAIDKVNALILENHLETCVTTAVRGDDPCERERAITELLDVFETSSKL